MIIVWFCNNLGWYTEKYPTREEAVEAAYNANDIGVLIAGGPEIQAPLQEKIYK